MNTKHIESELKFYAKDVKLKAFKAWAETNSPVRFVSASGFDTYWKLGDSVVRHRESGGAGELTVKKRNCADNTTHRLEVDLHFSEDTELSDVHAFLRGVGFSPWVKLWKDSAIYYFEMWGVPVSVVWYAVDCLGHEGVDHFIEVEIEKGGPATVDADGVLSQWETCLRLAFPSIGDRLNASLYEIYSGE